MGQERMLLSDSAIAMNGNSGGGADARRRLTHALLPPTLRSASAFRLRAGVVLVAIGLFTLSWERLANVGVGSYNVKLAVLVFALAALLLADRWIATMRAVLRRHGVARWLVVGLLTICVFFVLRALATQPFGPALAQVAAVISGALLPGLAVLGAFASRRDLAWGLRWLIAGASIASIFGLYQLLAFYTGLPQGIAYTGVGTSGSGGRIPAFNYEPAYFAYYLVLVLGAVLALARLEQRKVRWGTLLFFSFVLALVNVRALLFVIPVAAVLLAVDWRSNRGALGRALIAGVAGALLAIAVPVGGAALVTALHPPATASSPPDQGDGVEVPEGDPNPAPRANAPAAPQLPTDVLNPNEVSSNGPRLDLYKAVLKVDLAHPLIGVGPGALREALADDGYVAPNQGANVVANNVWLQAGADGGIPLVLLELAVVLAVGLLWWRSRRRPEQPLLASWLAVLLVGGMLTSYFFDIKIWVVLALAVCASLASSAEPNSAT